MRNIKSWLAGVLLAVMLAIPAPSFAQSQSTIDLQARIQELWAQIQVLQAQLQIQAQAQVQTQVQAPAIQLPPTPFSRVPFITSIDSTGLLTPGVRVVVNGRNFDQGSYIDFDGVQSIFPVSLTDRSLIFVLPSNATIGSHTIRVRQKASDAASNIFRITVGSLVSTPVITSIDSTGMITPGVHAFVIGRNFGQGSYIDFNGDRSIFPFYLRANTLSFVVPADIAPGTYSIRVRQKASDVVSNTVRLTVSAWNY